MTVIATIGLFQSLAGNLIVLSVATFGIGALKNQFRPAHYIELVQRVRTWWIIFGVFTAALLVGRSGFLVLLSVLSFLALKEYFSLIHTRPVDRGVILFTYLTIPVQYLWIGLQAPGGLFVVPVIAGLAIQGSMLIRGRSEGYLAAAATLQWGWFICVFCVSHVAYLRVLPAEPLGAGLVFYLVFLTEFNDVAQYLWGKLAGRHNVTPRLSPRKTWEGLVGGAMTTAAGSVFLAPLLTNLSPPQAIAAGLVIAVAGFFGDINISAVKRDIGIKDSGALLPGHGGVLDRIDSLTFTAPVFAYFLLSLTKAI